MLIEYLLPPVASGTLAESLDYYRGLLVAPDCQDYLLPEKQAECSDSIVGEAARKVSELLPDIVSKLLMGVEDVGSWRDSLRKLSRDLLMKFLGCGNVLLPLTYATLSGSVLKRRVEGSGENVIPLGRQLFAEAVYEISLEVGSEDGIHEQTRCSMLKALECFEHLCGTRQYHPNSYLGSRLARLAHLLPYGVKELLEGYERERLREALETLRGEKDNTGRVLVGELAEKTKRILSGLLAPNSGVISEEARRLFSIVEGREAVGDVEKIMLEHMLMLALNSPSIPRIVGKWLEKNEHLVYVLALDTACSWLPALPHSSILKDGKPVGEADILALAPDMWRSYTDTRAGFGGFDSWIPVIVEVTTTNSGNELKKKILKLKEIVEASEDAPGAIVLASAKTIKHYCSNELECLELRPFVKIARDNIILAGLERTLARGELSELAVLAAGLAGCLSSN